MRLDHGLLFNSLKYQDPSSLVCQTIQPQLLMLRDEKLCLFKEVDQFDCAQKKIKMMGIFPSSRWEFRN